VYTTAPQCLSTFCQPVSDFPGRRLYAGAAGPMMAICIPSSQTGHIHTVGRCLSVLTHPLGTYCLYDLNLSVFLSLTFKRHKTFLITSNALEFFTEKRAVYCLLILLVEQFFHRPDTCLHVIMLRNHWHTANALRCVPIYSPVVVGRPIHCAYTLRDGQAELARIASYTGGCFNLPQTVTHPATNRVQRRATYVDCDRHVSCYH